MGISEKYRGPNGEIVKGTGLNPTEITRALKKIFEEDPFVILVYLFGSQAENRAQKTSDVDVAVLLQGSEREMYGKFKGAMEAIREILGTERFDLVLLNDAPLSLQFEIISSGKLVHANDVNELNEYEMSVLRKVQDSVPLKKVQDEYLKKRVGEWYSKRAV